MKLKILSEHYEQKEGYDLVYIRVKFLGEIFEVCKKEIPFVDIMQFWFERKASKNCYIAYKYYSNSLWWKIKSKFWSKTEWQWRKIYQYYRKQKGLK